VRFDSDNHQSTNYINYFHLFSPVIAHFDKFLKPMNG